MKIRDQQLPQAYQNAMELLIHEEIERQIYHYPIHLTKYINTLEVATYALNRLPPLYASCEEGLKRQKERGMKEFRSQIVTAVRQGFAAVQRDPLRFSTPLIPLKEVEYQDAQSALQEIADFLPQGEISWRNLAKVVKQLVVQAAFRDNGKSKNEQVNYQLYGWTDQRYCR